MYDVQALSAPSETPAGEILSEIQSEAYDLNSRGDAAGIGFQTTVDALGQLVGGYEEGVIWTGGTLGFSLPIRSNSLLYAINGSGDAVGARATNDSFTQIAVLMRGGTIVDLNPAVGSGSIALDINDAGRACGWVWNNPRAFIYDAASSMVVAWIEPLPGKKQSAAYAINDHGDVAGMSDEHGFFLDGATMSSSDLGPIAFVGDLNNVRLICGSVQVPSPQNYGAVICDTTQASPTFVRIPPPAGFIGNHGDGVNDDGDVVGTCWNQSNYDVQQSAYIYHHGVSTDLNDLITAPEWHLEFAHRINNEGQIVGTGTLNGVQTAFLLTSSKPTWAGRAVLTLPSLVGTLLSGVTVEFPGWEIVGRQPVDGAGWVRVGGRMVPIVPWHPWEAWTQISESKRDALIALALDEVATYIVDRAARQKIRSALIGVARERLDQLTAVSTEARVGPSIASRTRAGRRALTLGKPAAALRRFRPQ